MLVEGAPVEFNFTDVEIDGVEYEVRVDCEYYLIERDVDCITYQVKFASYEDDVKEGLQALAHAECLLEKKGYRTTKEWSY